MATGGFAAAAAARASGSARAGLQWGMAALGTCVVFYVVGRGHVFPDASLAIGLSAILLGVAALFPIAGYVGGEVKLSLVGAALVIALGAATLAALVGVAPLAGGGGSGPVLRAALPLLVVPSLGVSAASPPGSREGWRLSHAVAAMTAFALILSAQSPTTNVLKHVIGAALGALLAGPVAVAALRGLLSAMGVVRPLSRRDLGQPAARKPEGSAPENEKG